VHRGIYLLGEQATAAYESARGTVQAFIGAASTEEVIFTSGTTASLNVIAHSLGELLIKQGDVILLSPMEHHSNLVPWQLLAKRTGAKLEFFDLTAEAEIDLATLPQKIHDQVKIVAVAHISNAAGTIHPIEEIIKLAHAKNIPVVIDAAQSVPHQVIDVQKLDCDFLAFSGHKLCGPTGIGVLYGKKQWLQRMAPVMGGGDMIREVSLESSTWNDLPYKFEAGTPNIAGAIGLSAAIEYLQNIGMDVVKQETNNVYDYLLNQLAELDFVSVFGPHERTQRSSIASFSVDNVHPHDVAQVLDQYNVAIRAGHHCCQPLMNIWQVPATARASVYFYNTTGDIDQLIVGLKAVYDKFK
jgi:cysteine desulfurase/selenocysteine lyase